MRWIIGTKPSSRVFVVASALGVAAAVYHLLALRSASGVQDDSSNARHLAFVLINLLLAWGFMRRPRWFVWAFSVLCAQQFLSHGRRALEWAERGRVDWVSLLVLGLLSIALVALVRDATQRVGGSER